jgi:Protein of unknown function (DUF3570)
LLKYNHKKKKLLPLVLVGLGGYADDTLAQTIPTQSELSLQYFYYNDWQGDGSDRMKINTPQFLLTTPLSESISLQASGVVDSMSGASPLYYDTLSGASGLGIEDERWAGDLRVTKAFEDFEVSVIGEYSSEDDFLARGGGAQVSFWNKDKTTTVSLGVSGSYDQISSTNNPSLREDRQTGSYLLGVTQVINRKTILQSNLTYTAADGYLTDPYKLFDNRPGNRDSFSWLTRLNHYFESTSGSLHADYRFYYDSWNISSHLAELSYYQPISQSVQIRPLVRGYTQNNAKFFSSISPPSNLDSLYSADQRMSAFGSVSGGLSVEYQESSFSLKLFYEIFAQDPSWRLGSNGSPSFERFWGQLIGVGGSFRW